MGSYDPSGNWINDRGQNEGAPMWSAPIQQWVSVSSNTIVPTPPQQVNTDPFGPGGQYTTADPLHPGFWYRDDPNISGGVQRIDAQGNVVGSYAYPGNPGGGYTGWDINRTDPTTGGPTFTTEAKQAGGLFGLGDVWGSLVGSALVLGAGFGLGALAGGPGAIALGGGAAAAGAPEAIAAPTALTLGDTALATGEAAGDLGAGGLAATTPADYALGAGATPEFLTAGSEPGLALASGSAGTTALGSPAADAAALQAITDGAGGAGAGSGLLSSLGKIAPVAGSVLSGLGSVAGGVISGNAAKSAADTQAQAARDANATLLAMYAQNRADLTPYRDAGYGGLSALRDFAAQPLTYGAYQAPPVADPSGYDLNKLVGATQFTPPLALDPSGYAFDPRAYAFTPPSGQDVLHQDPGYQFRVQQGQKALEQSAAGRGMQLSGAQLKDLGRFSQGLASQEYQNAYSRLYQQNQTAYERGLQGNQLAYGRGLQQNQDLYQRALAANQLDWERGLTANQTNYGRDYQQNQDLYSRGLQEYQTNLGTLSGLRTQRYNELAGLAGTGQTAATQLGQFGATAAAGVAGNQLSAGAATAAGQVGSANALNGAISGVGGAVNQFNNYQLLSSLLASRRAA